MKTLTINVSEPVYDEFRRYARKVDRKASELIREAMELYRQQHMQRRRAVGESVAELAGVEAQDAVDKNCVAIAAGNVDGREPLVVAGLGGCVAREQSTRDVQAARAAGKHQRSVSIGVCLIDTHQRGAHGVVHHRIHCW